MSLEEIKKGLENAFKDADEWQGCTGWADVDALIRYDDTNNLSKHSEKEILEAAKELGYSVVTSENNGLTFIGDVYVPVETIKNELEAFEEAC